MDSIFKIVVGATPSTSVGEYWNNGNIPWLPSGCCQDCTVDLSYPKIKYITQKGYDSCSTTMMFPSTVLIALTGATAGKVGLLTINACANQSVVGISAFIGIDPKFLYYQLMARRGEILSDCIGSAQPHISKDYITKMFFALPPLAEQQRIVTRISELNPLLIDYDSLEAQERKLDESLPNELRKSILQYAIQGKLVPQNPSDEPASVLLERIRSEREKANGGKKSKAKTESYIFKNSDDNSYYEKIGEKVVCIDEEIPFDIPDSWCWTRIGCVSNSYIGLTYKPTDVVESGGTIVLRSSNIQNGEIDLTDLVRVSTSIPQKLVVEKNDILICARNGSKKLVGKSAIIRETLEDMSFGAFMAICKSPLYEYLYLFLQSNAFYNQLNAVSGTTTINQLTQDRLNHFLIPIPPLGEQRRICEKYGQILEIASQ